MTNKTTNAKKIAERFVACINGGDVDGIAALMTEDHRFIDATGAAHRGRVKMSGGWAEYFATFPDYHIEIEDIFSKGETVALFGWARGSHKGVGDNGKGSSWRIPAAWRCLVAGGRLSEWRVYSDVEPMLQSMGVQRFGAVATDQRHG